jgi:hypothetical protein
MQLEKKWGPLLLSVVSWSNMAMLVLVYNCISSHDYFIRFGLFLISDTPIKIVMFLNQKLAVEWEATESTGSCRLAPRIGSPCRNRVQCTQKSPIGTTHCLHYTSPPNAATDLIACWYFVTVSLICKWPFPIYARLGSIIFSSFLQELILF